MTPFRKHPTHEDARRAQWLERGDPKIVERLRQVLYMGGQLHPVERPRGVHRFQTIADAQAWRAAWEGRRQAES